MARALIAILCAAGCKPPEPPAPPAAVPPRFVGLPEGKITLEEGARFVLDLNAISADGAGRPVVAGKALPKGALVENGRLSWTPDYNGAGEYTATVIACDRGACAERSLALVVVDDPHPPREFKKPCEQLPRSDPKFCPSPPPRP